MKIKQALKEVLKSKDDGVIDRPILSLRQRGVVHCRRARIASDLVPKADPNVKAGTKIFVIGNDGPNLDSERYNKSGRNQWLKALKDWLERGADITYFLLNPQRDALIHLRALTNSKHQGKLMVYQKADKSDIPLSVRTMFKEWETTHFAIFEQNDKPVQFWYESFHKVGETEAEDCYFFPKAAAQASSLPIRYKRALNKILSEGYARPAFS